MAKNTYYFPHDYNARGDEKLVKLRSKLDWSGVGLYWAIVEKLHENGGSLSKDYQVIAYDLHSEAEIIKSVVEGFELFKVNETNFENARVKNNLKHQEQKSKKAKASASIRWASTDSSTRSERISRARLKGTHTKEDWEEIKNFFNQVCVKCEGATNLNGIVKDHIIPIYKGGSDTIRNLQPLCAKCNNGKGQDTTDFRLIYSKKYNLEMPTKWLQDVYEIPTINESKVKEIKVNINKGSFKPPTLEELKDYIKQNNYNIDAEHWLDHYQSNGWKVGKNNMKDWKATVRTWVKRSGEFGQTKPKIEPGKYNSVKSIQV